MYIGCPNDLNTLITQITFDSFIDKITGENIQ